MHPIIALRFAWALVVMLSPVILLLLAFAPVARRYRTKVEQAWLLVLFALPITTLCLTAVSSASFTLGRRLLPVALLISLGVLVCRRPWRRWGRLRIDREDALLCLLLAGVGTLRLATLCVNGDSLGGGDARFHSMLSAKILAQGALSDTWAPFAPVHVVYPQGSHALVAGLASLAGLPIHHAFNLLLVAVAILTAAALYLVSLAVFQRRSAARWSLCGYGFLAVWGSLDLFRWGGLPNALGMLFLTLILWLVAEHLGGGDGGAKAALLGGLLLGAITMTHHYSLIVATLTLGSAFLLQGHANARRLLFYISLSGLAVSAHPLISTYGPAAAELGHSSILRFPEPFLSMWDIVAGLSPFLVALFLAAAITARHATPAAPRQLIWTWFAVLLMAFALLEYVTRAVVLLASDGQEFYAALTPSRMATDLVYPVSALLGGLVLSPHYTGRKRHLFIAAACLAALWTALDQWPVLTRVGRHPHEKSVAAWIDATMPANALVAGTAPHLEYLTGRQTTFPPLPASEARDAPALRNMRRPRSLDEWYDWCRRSKRAVCFLLPAGAPAVAGATTVFANERYEVRLPPWSYADETE